jgi:hypothetical protein
MTVKQIHELTALLLIAITGISGCNASTPAPLPPSPILCSQHPEGVLIQQDTVESLTRKADGISVLFSHHAAIYFVSKEDDCFIIWRDRLIESLKNNSEVEFAYIDAGQKIISIVAH